MTRVMRRCAPTDPTRTRGRRMLVAATVDGLLPIARMLGIPHSALSQWRAGTRRPDVDAANLLHRTLGIDVAAWSEDDDDHSVTLVTEPRATDEETPHVAAVGGGDGR